jgi:hypothetical protein
MTIAEVQRVAVRRNTLRMACWFALLSIPAAIAAYYRIFLSFSGWDDEGMDLSMVRQHLGGAKLFQEVFSPYGPVYYLYNWVLHSVLGVALSHNAVRITSAVVVLGCALGCAWIAWRYTNSLAAATIAHLAVFRGLQFFGNEPGHPQELCLILMLGLVASGILAGNPRWKLEGLAAAGSLAACLMLIKVNLGIFAAMSVALAIVFQGPAGRLTRMARIAAAAAAIASPYLLMRSHLDDAAGQAYCFIATVSVGAMIAGRLGRRWEGWFSTGDCMAAAGSFAVTIGGALAVLAIQGVPLAQVWYMLVLKHLRMSVQQHLYYLSIDLGWGWTLRPWMAWALGGVCAAVWFARARQSDTGSAVRWLGQAQFLLGSLGVMAAFAFPKVLVALVTPYCWLLLYPPDQSDGIEGHARMLLCTLTPLQVLLAYPMAGSQSYFVRILLMLVAVIALFDGLRALQATGEWCAAVRRLSGPVTKIVLVCAGLAYPLLAIRAKAAYAAMEPLGLPGAERIHLEKKAAAEYQWLVRNLSRNCDTFVGLPGMASLYIWSGKPLPGPVHQAPGGLSLDNWMLTHSAEEQQVIVDDLDRHPDACAVYTPRGVYFWYQKTPDLSSSPLATYIFTRFKTVDRMGDYQFMIRKERQWDTARNR